MSGNDLVEVQAGNGQEQDIVGVPVHNVPGQEFLALAALAHECQMMLNGDDDNEFDTMHSLWANMHAAMQAVPNQPQPTINSIRTLSQRFTHWKDARELDADPLDLGDAALFDLGGAPQNNPAPGQ